MLRVFDGLARERPCSGVGNFFVEVFFFPFHLVILLFVGGNAGTSMRLCHRFGRGRWMDMRTQEPRRNLKTGT